MSSVIKITLPDNSIREFDISCGVILGFDIAKSISVSLAKSAIAIKIDGEYKDLATKIDRDCKVEIITPKSGEVALDIIRHDAAHILAQAVKELFPETQVTIGPSIKDGFYYDFARNEPFSLEDLEVIEKRMHEISKRDYKIERQEWKRDDAIEFFKDQNEFYKAEIISSIPQNEVISLYKQGDFIDLCRGPHAPSTSYTKYFKLTKLSGAYWRGDSKNQMLQRIYGTAWESKESLEKYLQFIEEAKRRDHRKIGTELKLFHMQDEAAGSVFWHSNGWTIYKLIENYIREKLEEHNYIEVRTPQLVDKSLWEKSGHWEKFKENMFVVESKEEERIHAVKPMNCPCHVQIFNQELKSYRQLPLRMAEFGSCHRNEPSGSLHGIMRVRSFTQDDAHIFCEESQINQETIDFCELLKEVYKDFGFKDFKVKFSTRPEVRAGTDEIWDKSEKALLDAVKAANLEFEINEGEGAFYGPKLEFILVDALERHWQCGTLQVDFILPERLDASYIAKDGLKHRPVMLHRAILGSIERFIGILIENYAGSFPIWLAPIQVVIATITNDSDEYATKIFNILKQHKIRAELDIDAKKINAKIREHSLRKIPYIIAIGNKEQENNLLSIREFGSDKQYNLSVDEFLQKINEEIVSKKK